MTLKLILMRHAKSDWDDPSLDDHDRPLNERGKRAAVLIGKWLVANGHLPELALCSDAIRTRHTLELVSAQFPDAIQVKLLPSLYLASAQKMLDLLQVYGDFNSVLLVGHNPGTGAMAQMLGRNHPSDTDFVRYPTAFTTVYEFSETRWADIDWGRGTIVAAASARQLEKK